MRATSYLLILLCLTCADHLFAQRELNGIILNKDRKAIPFAHIGIPGKSVGTASFENGRFTLKIPKALAKSELKISAIGYQEKSVLISGLDQSGPIEIILNEKAIELKDVMVSSKKSRPETIFKTTKKKGKSNVWFGDSGGGTEMFTKVNISEGLYKISQANLMIGRNTARTFQIRFGFYEVNEENLPGERIIEKSFIAESKIKKGILKIDLDSENVWVEGDFYIGFEWIISAEQRAHQRTTTVDWKDYGVDTDTLGENTLSIESGKLIQIRDQNNSLVKEIPLSKSQQKEIKAKYDARQVTYLDMSGNHKSLYKVRSYADYRELVHSPFVEIIGYTHNQ